MRRTAKITTTPAIKPIKIACVGDNKSAPAVIPTKPPKIFDIIILYSKEYTLRGGGVKLKNYSLILPALFTLSRRFHEF